MNKLKHIITITDNIISDIEEIMYLPNDKKSVLKTLLLSNDKLNITLAQEIIKTISSKCHITFIKNDGYTWNVMGPNIMMKDPTKVINLIPNV